MWRWIVANPERDHVNTLKSELQMAENLRREVSLPEVLQRAIAAIVRTRIDDWAAYRVDNEMMNLERLRMWLPGNLELQINRIWHASAPHFHRAPMVSKIILGGYTWQLKQNGAAEFVRMFSTRGSIVSMGPLDIHVIERNEWEPSLSVCLFGMQYPEIPGAEPMTCFEADAILGMAIRVAY